MTLSELANVVLQHETNFGFAPRALAMSKATKDTLVLLLHPMERALLPERIPGGYNFTFYGIPIRFDETVPFLKVKTCLK
jgi:hypothetical protein